MKWIKLQIKDLIIFMKIEMTRLATQDWLVYIFCERRRIASMWFLFVKCETVKHNFLKCLAFSDTRNILLRKYINF